jgi:uncharacterized damage-inducible protein DinB
MLQALAQYNNHANKILMEAASKLTAEEFSNTASPSRESFKKLLLHLLAVEAAYYARCRGEKFSFDPKAFPTFGAVEDFANATAIHLTRLIDSLSEDDYAREVTGRFGDESLHFPIWQMLLHAFMHTARHRGELSIILSHLGQPLPIPDIIVQFADASGQEWPFERE